MHVFKHPKYYTELRKRNKSDQVISLRAQDGECERAPGQGLKLQAASSEILEPRYMDIGEVLGGKRPRVFAKINVLCG